MKTFVVEPSIERSHQKMFNNNPQGMFISMTAFHARIQKITSAGGGGGEGVLKPFFTHQRISQRTIWTSFQKQLDPRGSIQLLLEGFRTIIS